MDSDVPASSTAPDGGKRRRPALVRLVRIALVALASLVILYIVAINLFLSTSLFARVVNATPETIEIQFERGWSIIPRHVHAKKLSIRGRDSNVEWRLTLDDVEFDISFSSLLKQRFAASHIHGKGLSFRLRQRLDAPPSSPDEVAGLPPIEGFPPYSVRPPPAPSPDVWNDADYHLWTAHLEDIVAEDVRELWLDNAHFEGSARIDGRFYLKPLRAVEVGPVHITIARGQVSTRTGPVAEALDGSALAVTVPRFDPRTATSADILRETSLTADAHVTLPERAGLPLASATTIHGAVEVRRAALRISSGRLQKDSHLVVRMPSAVVISAKHRVTGALALDAEVAPSPSDGRDRLTFRAEMTHVEVEREGGAKHALRPLLRAPRVVATGDSGALDLARPFEDLHVVLEMPEGDLADARELSRYIPPTAPISLLGGHPKAELRFEAWLAEKRATGSGVLRAEDLDLRLAKLRVRGGAAIRAEFASYRFDTRRIEGAQLVLKLSDATLASTTAPDVPLVHTSAAQLTAGAAVVDPDDPLRALSVSVSLPAADIVSRGLLRAYLPKGSEMQIASSHSRFSLDLNLVIAGHLAQGGLDIRSRALTIDYRDLRLDTEVRARARVHHWRWETGDLALDEATVDLENLTLTKGRTGAPPASPAMSVARIGLAVKSPRFGFEDPLARVDLSAFFVDARVHDYAAINAFLPEKATFRLEGGEGAFGARIDLDVDHHTAKGTLRAHASRMGAGNETVHLRGDVDLFASFVDWNLAKNTMRLLGSSVQITRATGRFGAAGPPTLSAGRIALSTSTPRLSLADPRLKGSDFRLVIERADLPDARALSPLLPADSVFGIDSGAAHVAADVTVSDSRRAAAGGIAITLARAGVRLNTTHLSGDFRFLARVSGFDPERHELDISGTRLEMRDVAVTGATATTSHWQGDIGFSRGVLRLSPEPVLDGIVDVDARDVRPVLAVVFGNDLSRFVVRLLDMPRLRASARLLATSRELALVDLDARGGNLALRGSYAVRDGRRRGAFIARKAFVSVGLRLDDQGARARFFGLERWLRERTCGVKAFVDISSPTCAASAATAHVGEHGARAPGGR